MGAYIGPGGQRRVTVDGTPWDRHVAALPDWTREHAAAGQPARNASRDAWAAYARQVAQTSDEADAIDGLTRDELIDVFASRDGSG